MSTATGLERLIRAKTRILTEGTAGTANPPLPAAAGAIFIGASFRSWDVTDPTTPFQIVNVTVPAVGFGQALLLDEATDTCYCINPGVIFSVIDVSDPNLPVVVGQATAGVGATDVNLGLARVGTNCYICSRRFAAGVNTKLFVVDVSVPAAPAVSATYLLNTAFAVAQNDAQAIVSASPKIYVLSSDVKNLAPLVASIFAVYDVTNPLAITQQGTISYGVPAFNQNVSLAINGTTVWAGFGGDGAAVDATFRAINVSNPAAPANLGAATSLAGNTALNIALFVDGTTLYVAANKTIYTYDVSNPAAPSLSSTLALALLQPITSIFVRDGIAYLGEGRDSEAEADFAIASLSTGLLSENPLTGAVLGAPLVGFA